MRLAWVSPLPPARTGIADYSVELVGALAGRADLSLFAPVPAESSSLVGISAHPLEALPAQVSRFDQIVYHLGNNHYHVDIYDLALRLPGVVVLHDYILHHMVARCTVAAGDLEGYIWHLAYERGPAGVGTALRRRYGAFSEMEQFLDPLNRVVLDRSRGVIVHNRWSAERIRESHPALPVCWIPQHLAPSPGIVREEARRQLAFAPDQVVVASFGFIARYKRVDSLLAAWATLCREHPEVRCLLVGSPDHSLDLPALLHRFGLLDRVAVTGYVDLELFYRYIAACDIAVNLRYPTAGETSGALLRLLGSGKAVIISNVQPFAEWPDDVCLKVDLGPAEVPMLLHYLRRLVEAPALCRQLGENARRYVETYHTLERSAGEYLSFLERTQ